MTSPLGGCTSLVWIVMTARTQAYVGVGVTNINDSPTIQGETENWRVTNLIEVPTVPEDSTNYLEDGEEGDQLVEFDTDSSFEEMTSQYVGWSGYEDGHPSMVNLGMEDNFSHMKEDDVPGRARILGVEDRVPEPQIETVSTTIPDSCQKHTGRGCVENHPDRGFLMV